MPKLARFLPIVYSILLFLYALPSTLYAQDKTGPAGILQLQQTFQRFINLSVGLAFMLVTLMLAWAGIKFITSGGEQKALHEVWQIVTWALLGIVFLVIGWLVLVLMEAITGAPVTKVNLCAFFPNGACPTP